MNPAPAFMFFAATQPVPEPASLPLFATGAAALCASDEAIA
jgi:hypothetical protein